MGKDYWQGRADERSDWNDREHARIYELVKKIQDSVNRLNAKATRWGAVGGIVASMGAYLAALFISHICR